MDLLSPAERHARQLAARRSLKFWICRADLAKGRAHIHLLSSSITLASFHDFADAIAWFPQGADNDA